MKERLYKYGNKVNKHGKVRLGTYDVSLKQVLNAVGELTASGFKTEDMTVMADVEDDCGDPIPVLYVEASKELEGKELEHALKQLEEQEQQAAKTKEEQEQKEFQRLFEKYGQRGL